MMREIELAPTALLVTALTGADHMAQAVSERAGVVIELVRSRRAALASLRRHTYDAVIVDSTMPGDEVTPTQILWQTAGDALPMELDLRAVGAMGTARLLRSLLNRRDQMEFLVRDQVMRSVAESIRVPLTTLLLQSDLVLRDGDLTPSAEAKVREMRALADDMRVRLRPV